MEATLTKQLVMVVPCLIDWSDPTDPGRWSLWVNGHRAFGKPVLLGFNAGRPAHDHAHLTDR
ncbi:hypothetical protein ACFRMN_14445 [Streptomyces sp. NPDC056835]|uniref:hypothetical protein n=1 Tax=Streptomyces sp. NPDC056835 TaxID=3345956 RepID=UPI00369E4276